MKTTAILVEFLVGGILVMLALVVLTFSFFPDQTIELLDDLNQYQSLPMEILLTTIFIATAYAFGILSESIGLTIFEWKLNRIKYERFKKYLKKNQANLKKSPILQKYEKNISKVTKKEAILYTSTMRYHVMMESEKLYQDILSQLHRMRLMRMFFLAEIILIVAVSWRLLCDPSQHLMYVLILFVLLALTNAGTVVSRLRRYCKAVERSYRVLVLDK